MAIDAGDASSESSTVDDTVERVAQAAHEAIDMIAAKAQTFGESQEEWLEMARTLVRENPVACVAAAVAAGLVVGRLIR